MYNAVVNDWKDVEPQITFDDASAKDKERIPWSVSAVSLIRINMWM